MAKFLEDGNVVVSGVFGLILEACELMEKLRLSSRSYGIMSTYSNSGSHQNSRPSMTARKVRQTERREKKLRRVVSSKYPHVLIGMRYERLSRRSSFGRVMIPEGAYEE
jgi:hypothetical protein